MDDIEHTANGDHMYAEKPTCLLEENDSQCGHVFYNEITRLLKFFCTYCRETYDNIEYFCQHLSEHINETESLLYNKAEGEDEDITQEVEEIEYIAEDEEHCLEEEDSNDIESKSVILNREGEEEEEELAPCSYADTEDCNDDDEEEDESTRDAFEYEKNPDFNDIPAIMDQDINHGEMLIEEIGDAEEIRAEVNEEEMLETFVQEENLNTAEIVNYEENANAEVIQSSNNMAENKKMQNSFEECFIKETNIDKIRSEGVCVLKEKNMKERNKPVAKRKSYLQDFSRLKRKRKKVTTVKVIAVKNRIAELYERIQLEQQKSQQLFSSEFLNNEQETQDAIESLINVKEEQQNTAETKPEVTRKIIGETLITLIPEGTQIPSKLPSPVNKTLVNTNLLKNDLKTSSSTCNSTIYDFPKKEDATKEKLAVCPACGKTFRSHFSLTIHKRIHYLESDSSVKLAHKCSDCDQLFNKLSQLKHHVETVHYPEGFICKICNRQLSSLSLLERHMVKVHLDRPFNCKHCNKNFSDPLTYEEHLASHNSGEVFKCTTCGRKYATEFFLMEHMRNHKEQVPQTCVVCGKVTLRITQHMKIHTPRPKRLLSCSVCGKVFNFSSGLSHHFKIMHKLPRPPPKPKKESQQNSLKRRRRLKTNERAINRKKSNLNSSTETEFMLQNDKFPDQIIEEQIEIPHEVYEDNTNSVTLLPEATQQKHHFVGDDDDVVTSCNLPGSSHIHHQVVDGHDGTHAQDVINHKEEEAKRVIVELIQNSSYTSFFPDNLSSVLEVTPPIAREETIAAVNSIVHDC